MRAVVVGGGFGGLSAACYLAAAGADVTVLEKNEQMGGRASRLTEGGFRFDMGPSWYLMPDVFENFFADFGKVPGDFYALQRLEPYYRIFFKDGDALEISADRTKVKAVFERYEPGSSDRLDDYLDHSQFSYETGLRDFVYRDRDTLLDFVSLDTLRNARGLKLLGSMQDHVSQYFKHPKLQQIMLYSLVFLGGSPKNTPAIYNLMSHVDFGLGVFYPLGGIGAVVDAVTSVAESLGVRLRVDSEVTRIGPAGRNGLSVEVDGESIEADVVVSNADLEHTDRRLLPSARHFSDRYWDSRVYAPSAFLLYLGVQGGVGDLAHHSLVLPGDWDPHFESIFSRPGWPENPAYYVCAPSVTDDSVAPSNHSNLFILVPIAPGLADDEATRKRYRDLVLGDLARHTGCDFRGRIVYERSFSVSDFASRYNSAKGTALGLAHTLRQTSFLRPGHRSKKLKGLYFTGANTRPGIGVPMCLISGKITAAAVLEDLQSLSRAR